MDKIRIVSVSFHSAGKIFDFDAKDLDLKTGQRVVVETERGRALGYIVTDPRMIDPTAAPPKLKAVLRHANEADLDMADKNANREAEALRFCHQRVQERKMDMKLVRAEYLFDGSKIVFYFTADGRVDFRELVRDLAQHFRTRIEMRQIGVRDEAKLTGGLGICGRELCCCSHLRNFAPVSVKMAKAQGLALNPSKISGQCGRLLCCLAYEYETYNELRKTMPKCGKKVELPSGPAEVISLNILGQKFTVVDVEGKRCDFSVAELQGTTVTPVTPAPNEQEIQPQEQPESKRGRQKTDRPRGERKPGRRSNNKKNDGPKEKGKKQESGQARPTGPESSTATKDGQEQKPARRRRSRRRPKRRPGQNNPNEQKNPGNPENKK